MKTILIADDNPASCELLREALAPCGARILEATDGREALHQIQKESPDLALLDIQMPILDGFAVVKAVRSLAPRSKTILIAVTALAMESERRRIIDAGFDGYVSKPIWVAELREQVNRLLSGDGKAEHAEI